MDILPYILSEDMLRELTDDHLLILAKCCTNRVKSYYTKYLECDGADQECKRRINDAFDRVLSVDRFLSSEETGHAVEVLKGLDITGIGFDMEVDMLQEIIDSVVYVRGSEYAVPYISPVDKIGIKELKEELELYCRSNPTKHKAKQFLSVLKKSSGLFQDKRWDYSRGTAVKNIVKNPDKYEVIRRGAEFVLKHKGDEIGDFGKWRML